MQGDFTRLTYRPSHHHSSVRLQQGRALLDADWNEQIEIAAHREETTFSDAIGPFGAPVSTGGFKITPASYPQDVVFFGTAQGWAVGLDAAILTTANGGAAWTRQAVPAGVTAHLRAVHFVSATQGWAVGDGAVILTTANGGVAWTVQPAPAGVKSNLRGVCFVSATQGWAVGDGGLVLATANGGGTWTPQAAPAGVTGALRSLRFLSAAQGWIVGNDGVILTTTNGGTIWTKQAVPAGVTAHLWDVDFASGTARGWAVGDDATILTTADGGTNWTKQTAPAGVTAHLRAVQFANATHGWAVGEGGTVLTTADGGVTWTAQLTPASAAVSLRSLAVISPTQAVIAGDNGTILATTASGVPWTVQPAPPASSLSITPGRIYLDGIVVENDRLVALTLQPDLPGVTLPTAAGTYVAYLDVRQRHLTATERPALREVALGGPDTATRTQTVWQVQLQPAAAGVTCAAVAANFSPASAGLSSGKLRARAEAPPPAAGECLVPPGAGYRRLENQLYRVEIHQPGSGSAATFKWSRDNGSIVTRLEKIEGNVLTIAAPGRDSVLGFDALQWVELSDEDRLLQNKPGVLVKLSAAAGTALTVDAWPGGTALTLADFGKTPAVRRWDSAGDLPLEPGNAVALEEGVLVEFTPGDYRTGDYWTIPARTLTGTVEWPSNEAGPVFEGPHGIVRHFGVLALVKFDGSGWSLTSDCRPQFPALTELTSLEYISGDGQEVLPGQQLARPLQAGVANGRWPVTTATVRFRITSGVGSLTGGGNTGADISVATNVNGVYECAWTLDGTTPSQQVEATLLNSTSLPICFNANLSLAAAVAYDPKGCPVLTAAKADTVQKAIDGLCKAIGGGPAIHVREVVFGIPNDPLKLGFDTDVRLDQLAAGIFVNCGRPLDPVSIGRPTCFVTVEVPLPASGEVVPPQLPPGYLPLYLRATVKPAERGIQWTPDSVVVPYLDSVLRGLPREGGDRGRLLAHLTLKGNFLWSKDDAEQYLDCEVFGVSRGPGKAEVEFRGDGRPGGDFDMWFWIK